MVRKISNLGSGCLICGKHLEFLEEYDGDIFYYCTGRGCCAEYLLNDTAKAEAR
jgi:hypothetical protein